MDLPARYHDGATADVAAVIARIAGAVGQVFDAARGPLLAEWPAAEIFPVHARRGDLRIGAAGRPYGERLVFSGEAGQQARAALPAIGAHHRSDRGRQLRLLGLSTMALVSVVVAYLFGVPLLASRITHVIPVAWEEQFGETVAAQIEATLQREGGFQVCDPDPQSLANRAIHRFALGALEGSGSPFTPDVRVIRSTIPNAFALPGGRAFYFSALLNRTETADEFAGVLAHELGHVAHRHAMEQLIASAGTGLLIGFIVGDLTGISVAGGLGAALVDSRFSREAERQADRFAAEVARRMAFQPAGLTNLLERVASDDSFTRALALLSTHPLTSERRAALEQMTVATSGLAPAFSEAEWHAIKTMCEVPAPNMAPSPVAWPPPVSGGADGKSLDKPAQRR